MERTQSGQLNGSMTEVLNRMDGVIASKIIEQNGLIETIHIIIDKQKSPKQISRDVQTVFAAYFDLELDHRKISVAALDGFDHKNTPHKRIEFEGLSTTRTANGALKLSVQLSLEGQMATGTHEAFTGRRGRYKVATDATLEALRQLFDQNMGFISEETTSTEVAGEELILAAITCIKGDKEKLLVGSAVVEHSDYEAAVKATLDAINRRLSFL